MTDDQAWWVIATMIFCALAFLAWFYRWLFPAKPEPVIGSELDRRWADVAHAHQAEQKRREQLNAAAANAAAFELHQSGSASSIIGQSIAETHLGPISASKPHTNRVDHGFFGVGNRPPNAGTSKQIERLHLAGVPHASAVAMLEADCTQNERRVIHMREQGDSLALIASRLGVSVAKVRRLEAKAVDKIIAAREKS